MDNAELFRDEIRHTMGRWEESVADGDTDQARYLEGRIDGVAHMAVRTCSLSEEEVKELVSESDHGE
jgi:hypothetical protein